MALSRPRRLTKKKDFDLVFKKGRSIRGSFVYLRVLSSDLVDSRFGFIVPAKIVKKAVARNRIRRVLSETVRSVRNFPSGYDIVVMLSKNPTEDSGVLKADLVHCLEKIPTR